jgi:MerR family transcriptional regulator, heat shock protein HspR
MPRARKTRTRSKPGYMISAVAEMYNIHPQTLRLYEREGLLLPSRSDGNTRLYSEEDLERLEVILSLTRDLGVNLAGIEIILNMRARINEMEREVQALVEFVRREFARQSSAGASPLEKAMVRVGHRQMVRTRVVRAS